MIFVSVAVLSLYLALDFSVSFHSLQSSSVSSLPRRFRCSCINTCNVQMQCVVTLRLDACLDTYAVWMRTWCSRRDRSFAQNRTVQNIRTARDEGRLGNLRSVCGVAEQGGCYAARAGRAGWARAGGVHSKQGA